MIKYQGLCFRCEHRALASEGQSSPRYECGNKNIQVISCYMYQPTKPIITRVATGYKKYPRFGPAMISAREMGVELLKGRLIVKNINKGDVCLYWVPDETK